MANKRNESQTVEVRFRFHKGKSEDVWRRGWRTNLGFAKKVKARVKRGFVKSILQRERGKRGRVLWVFNEKCFAGWEGKEVSVSKELKEAFKNGRRILTVQNDIF